MTPFLKHQFLHSPLLAGLPLIFTAGQTVWHQTHGMCDVIKAQGARRRLISFHLPTGNQACHQPMQKWVDVAELSDMSMFMQRDLMALSPDEVPSVDNTKNWSA